MADLREGVVDAKSLSVTSGLGSTAYYTQNLGRMLQQDLRRRTGIRKTVSWGEV